VKNAAPGSSEAERGQAVLSLGILAFRWVSLAWARLAERESLAWQIHDSVLQALALVHKRGRELAADGPVQADQVAGLAEMAAAPPDRPGRTSSDH
jgi:signal transduction histidine kinase